MTAPRREQAKSNARTTIDGNINDTTLAINVTLGSVFPATGNFRVRIGSELIGIESRSSNTLTAYARGIEGTTAASHTDLDDIELVLTADSIQRFMRDNIPNWGYHPPLNKIVADDGVTILDSTDFTWVNQGTSTATDENGTILMTGAAATGLNIRALTRTAPSTPYVYIMGFQYCMPRAGSNDGVSVLVGFRESSTGEIQMVQVGANTDDLRLSVQNWTNATTFSANLRSPFGILTVGTTFWFKIEDNGTNLIKFVSLDGVDWIQVESEGRTAFMAGGPDEILWGLRNDENPANEAQVRLVHWSRLS